MRVLNLIFFVLLSNVAFSQITSSKDSVVESEHFAGEWMLDLRPSPDADPYFQTLIISHQGEDKFSGLFYGSQIKDICLNKSWNKVYFAFKSSDNSNEYYQTGYIIGDEIFGVTYCPGRDFVMPWSGKKRKK